MPLLSSLTILIHLIGELSSGAVEFFTHIGGFLDSLTSRDKSWQVVARDWQTLIAGLLAFVPAAFAAVFVWRQINEQRTQFLKAQEASALKARLRLSRNLSHISRHLDLCYDRLLSEDFSYDQHVLPGGLLDDVLEAAVASRGDNFRFFQGYIEKLQTYASLCGVVSDIGGEANLVKCFMLLGEIDAQTDRIYPFSRFEVEKIDESSISLEEVKSRLQHNLRRGADISGSNFEALLSLGHFDETGKHGS